MEGHISQNKCIQQAKLINLAEHDVELEWTVAVSLQSGEMDTTSAIEPTKN